MSAQSSIEWTDATWNPIVGCTIVSPGCTNCYAMKMASRIRAMGGAMHYAGTTKSVNGNAVWTGKVERAPDHILEIPLHWKKPKRVFVNSMGDLFHESIPNEWIDRVFAVMALCPQHTFQVLTKRAERMREYFTASGYSLHGAPKVLIRIEEAMGRFEAGKLDSQISVKGWPLANVWLGISCERQQEADERIPLLLQTPAAVRFISAEPLLGGIDLIGTFARYQDSPQKRGCAVPLGRQLVDWVIVGGESGPKARPMHPDWARSLRDQCQATGVSFFFKQWGAWSDTHSDWPRCKAHAMANDGTLYAAEDIAFPDGPRYGEAIRANHDKARLCSMYLLGKKSAGRLLDGRTWDEMPR